jgi:hypothetical protein
MGQNLIGTVAIQPNATSVSPYLFSSNKIETFLVLPENKSHQQKIADSVAHSAVFV